MTAKHETDFLLYLEPPTSTWLLATAMDESGALDVLGLSDRESYSAAEVRRAYRRMALLYHPDKLQSPSKITEEEGSVEMMDDFLEIGKMILVGVFRGETKKHQTTFESMVHVLFLVRCCLVPRM